MADIKFDPDKLPDKLETMEDYQLACQNFVLPYMHQQAMKIADVVRELHAAIDNGDLDQEGLDLYVNQIKDYTAFASDDSPVIRYFREVMELEQRLDEAGEFDKLEENK